MCELFQLFAAATSDLLQHTHLYFARDLSDSVAHDNCRQLLLHLRNTRLGLFDVVVDGSCGAFVVVGGGGESGGRLLLLPIGCGRGICEDMFQ